MLFKNLIKDSFIYGFADFLSKSVAFFTFPLIASALSAESFGILELVTTSTTLIGLLINCGINNSVQRFYWDETTSENEQPVIVSTGLYLICALGIVGFVIGLTLLVISKNIIFTYAQELSWTGLISALFIMILTQWQQFILDVTRLTFSPWKFMSLSLLSRVLGLAFGVFVVVNLNGGLNGLLLVQALVLLAVMPLALWLIKDQLVLSFSKDWTKGLFNYGYPFIFTSISIWLLSSIDRWMLASMASVEEVGIYSIAFRFSLVTLFISSAFGQAWSPYSMKIKLDHPERYRKIYGKALLLLVILMTFLSSALILFSNEIISYTMPREYLSSAPSLSVLCLSIIFQSSIQITATGISLEKKTYIFARLSFLVAILNIILNYYLIPRFGALGASWATAISYLVMTTYYLHKTQILHPITIDWHKLFFVTILAVGLTFCGLIASSIFPFDSITFKAIIFFLSTLLLYWVSPYKINGKFAK